MNRHLSLVVAAGFLVSIGANNTLAATSRGPAAVDEKRLLAADEEPGNWMSHGRTYSEQRYSPLDQINASNVKNLGLAWSFELSTNRAFEATPIVVDGIMYVTSAWSLVYALDAASGKLLWKYDPNIPREVGFKSCCDSVQPETSLTVKPVTVLTVLVDNSSSARRPSCDPSR